MGKPIFVLIFMSNSRLKNFVSLPINAIKLPAQQPRRFFAREKLAQLTESVKHNGILENLLVRPLNESEYELVAGERRYRAAIAAGLTEVPVTVKELTDKEALLLSLTENLQRENLNPVEETEGILSLLSIRLGLSVEAIVSLLYQLQNQIKKKVSAEVDADSLEAVTKVFQELGLMNWESFVNNRLPLLNLPSEILEALRQGKIAYTKAKAIATLKDEEARSKLLWQAIEENLSLVEIKQRIKPLKSKQNTTSPNARIKQITHRLDRAKLWKEDPKRWEQVESYMAQIEALLTEAENYRQE